MRWDDAREPASPTAAASVSDVAFRLAGGTLPVDHADALRAGVESVLGWIGEDPRAGIHPLAIVESGNGWMRPEPGGGAPLYLSRRTRLVLRVPAARAEDARALAGSHLDVDGHALGVGDATLRPPIRACATLFARYVAGGVDESEADFTDRVVEVLGSRRIEVRKLLCGRERRIATASGALRARGLMLADLEPRASVALQCEGLGPARLLGCGLFVPHKGIAAVGAGEDRA